MGRYRSAMAAPLTIVNVGYRSTNFWVLSVGRSRFLVDLGWWGLFGLLAAWSGYRILIRRRMRCFQRLNNGIHHG